MSAFDLKDKGSENASGSLCVKPSPELTVNQLIGWKQIETNGTKRKMETKTEDWIALCEKFSLKTSLECTVNWMERKLFVLGVDNDSFTRLYRNGINYRSIRYVFMGNI